MVLKLDVSQEGDEGETTTYDGNLQAEASQVSDEEPGNEEESETKFWSFSSGEEEEEEEDEDVFFANYNQVMLEGLVETAQQRWINPILRRPVLRCLSVTTGEAVLKSDAKQEDPRESVKDLEFSLMDGDTRTVKIGTTLSPVEELEYAKLFTECGHLFIGAQQELPQTVVNEHKIELQEGAKPKVHKLRRIKPEHMQAMKAKVDKLLTQGCIVPVDNLEWVSPLVIVLKKNGKVRVCVDYRKLNKTKVKNRYPLPFIDCILDAVAGHEFFSFCDGYVGFHQIPMRKIDVLKTTFITPWNVLLLGSTIRTGGRTWDLPRDC